jgi:hypothetical protein
LRGSHPALDPGDDLHEPHSERSWVRRARHRAYEHNLTAQGAIASHWQWTLLPSVAATITGLLATAAAGAEHVGKEDVYAAYEMAASNPQDVGVTVLASVQRAFLENDRALQGKRHLTAATFGLLLLSALLIGLLNLGNQATLGLL